MMTPEEQIKSLEGQLSDLQQSEDADYQDLFNVSITQETTIITLRKDYDKAMFLLRCANESRDNIAEEYKRVCLERRELKSLLKSVKLLLGNGQIDHAKELLV